MTRQRRPSGDSETIDYAWRVWVREQARLKGIDRKELAQRVAAIVGTCTVAALIGVLGKVKGAVPTHRARSRFKAAIEQVLGDGDPSRKHLETVIRHWGSIAERHQEILAGFVSAFQTMTPDRQRMTGRILETLEHLHLERG